MKLATLRTATGTVAVRVISDTRAVEIPGISDIGALLAHPNYSTLVGTRGAEHDLTTADWAPVVPHPGKIICVGLNYRGHITEMGREIPRYPTLFVKYPETLVGAFDPIDIPAFASHALDWEGELAVVVGRTVRHATPGVAEQAIGGYAVLNDVTMRDFQYRTPEWLQGKTFEKSTPFGPVLVTPDEYRFGELRTIVDGDVKQLATTGDLVFSPADLIGYISSIVTLNPGDVIASGTPGGVGHARTPAEYLRDGQTLVTEIDGIGALTNRIRVSSLVTSAY